MVAKKSSLPKTHLKALVRFSKTIGLPSMMRSLSENSALPDNVRDDMYQRYRDLSGYSI